VEEADERIVVARQPAVDYCLLTHSFRVAGVLPPGVRRFLRRGHHPGNEDEHLRRQALGDQRASERAERLRDNGHRCRRVPGDLHHRLGALDQRRRALDRQIGRHGVVAQRAEFLLHEVPVPP
jgi:hypothetical protein